MAKNPTSLFEGVDISDVDKLMSDLDQLRRHIAEGLLDKLFQIDPSEDYEQLKQMLKSEFDFNALQQKVEVAVEKMVRGDALHLQDAFGISDEGMEALYFMGHSMFEQRNYPAARRAFELLLHLNPYEPRFHHALGATQHKQKDFLAAAQSYLNALVRSPVSDPELHFHCADCYLKMDDLISAIVSLGHCIESCDERQERHRQLRARCTTLREILIQKHAEREQEKERSQVVQARTRHQARKLAGEIDP